MTNQPASDPWRGQHPVPPRTPPGATTQLPAVRRSWWARLNPAPPPPPPDPPPGGGSDNRSQCDPNYEGCVPIADDVDCEGGGGNGPAYVRGPVRIIGIDIYELDRNNDGVGCE